jgi:hypothetical protein
MNDRVELSIESHSCESSRQAQEPLFGSGTHATHWLLVEYDTPWPARALKQADLPEPVKQHLLDFKNQVEGARVQFFRGREGVQENPRLFLARADQLDRPLQKIELTSYEQLLDFDLAALFEGDVPPAQRYEPILAICTNGKRDLCCAKYGTAAFHAMAAIDPEHVFQTTHIGGHRFAANALWLPYGVNYGRLEPEQAGDLLAMMDKNQISLANYRGHTTMPAPAQAADHYLRQHGNWLEVADLRLEAIDGTEPHWQVSFWVEPAGESKTVEVTLEPESFEVFLTSGDSERSATGHFHCQLTQQ